MAKRLVIKTGEYQKDGETKGEYTRLGVMLDSEHGPYILIDPTVSIAGCLTKQNMLNHKHKKDIRTSVLVNIFDDDNKKQATATNENLSDGEKYDDDIPF